MFETARREVKEETDLDVEEFELISINDELRYIETDHKHYVGIGVLAKYKGGEPKVMEPHKSIEWKWFDLVPPQSSSLHIVQKTSFVPSLG